MKNMASDDRYQKTMDPPEAGEKSPKIEGKPFEIRFDEINPDGKRETSDPEINQDQSPQTSKAAENNKGKSDITVLLSPPCEVVKKSCMEEECLREKRYNTLMKECTHIVKQEEQKYTKESFRRVFQDEDFLERLFMLFDQDQKNYLVQEDWVEFLKERLVDEKQIDLAEQVESVSYVLCGQDVITLEKFCQIFLAKGIVDKIFRLIDNDNDGIASPEEILAFISNICNPRPRTGFDKSSLEWLENLFRQTVGNEKEIRREDFQKIVISKNPFFTERVFQIFDKDNSGSISLQEFLDAMHQFSGKSPEDKIRFLFKVYDLDGDGLIQQRELRHVLRACMEENGMKFSEAQLADLADALLEDADPTRRGAITYEDLKRQLGKHGGLLENLTISIDRWLVPPKPKPPPASNVGKIMSLRPYQLSVPYLKNNYVYLSFLGAFILVNLGLFISRAIQYRHSNGYVIVARACGQCLNFDCMWVLVLMLRRCITFLRTRGLGLVLPLDQHIYLHKVTGMLIFIFSVVHTIMHLLNFSIIVVNDPVLNKNNYTLYEWLMTAEPKLFGLVEGCANPTGVSLIIILVIMFICSQAFVRRGGSFEVFYWSHLLYIPFWIILIFHGPNFWKWFIIPGFIYIVERISRLAWMGKDTGKTYISSGILLPSKVTHLVIKRPHHFDFHPGDYVFVNIPAIAKYEWHPFTISSAPEQDDYIWLHIRGVGQWTNRLYEWFDHERERLHAGEVPPVTPRRSLADTSKLVQKLNGIQRSLSNKENGAANGNGIGTKKKKSLEFSPTMGLANDAFTIDEEKETTSDHENQSGTTSTNPAKILAEKKLSMMLNSNKTPFEKSRSMPDIQVKTKKRDRLMALKGYNRSESEKSFDECQVKKAHLQALGLAYYSPQNKSLAQSFRYMRTKPTIIAFKTPSLENCEQRDSTSSIITIARRRLSKTISPDKDPEEGQMETVTADTCSPSDFPFINYPVGKPLEIFLDGPYGAPSSHIFRAQHAVLVATGIGVTPFASILQSIMHKYWKARHSCPKCEYTWASDIPPTIMNLRKVDFFWINREQRSFEWFVSLLSQLEMEQAELGGALERFLDMHMYITSALQKCDMKAVGLQLALDLLHEKEKRDLITGLKTRTNAGRPNWDKVFKQIQNQKKGKVTVFYCGPPQLARVLRVKCDQFGFSFRKECF